MHTMGSAHSSSESAHDDIYGGVSVDASSSSAQLALARAHIGELVVFARSSLGTHAASIAPQRTALRSVLERTAAAVAQLDAAFADAASAATAAAAAHAPSGSSTRVSLAASLTSILSTTGTAGGGALPSAEAALLSSPYLQSVSPPSRRPCAAVHRHHHPNPNDANDANESALSSPPPHSQRPTERSQSASKAHRGHINGHSNASPPTHASRSVSNSAVSPPPSASTASAAYASPTRYRHAAGGSPDARSPAFSAAGHSHTAGHTHAHTNGTATCTGSTTGSASAHSHTTGSATGHTTGTGTVTGTGRAAVHQARCIAEARAAVAAAHAALSAVAQSHERQAAAVDGAQREFRQLETRVHPSSSAAASAAALFGSVASPSFSSSSAAAPALPVSSTTSATASASATAPSSISASAHLLTARATLLQHQRRHRQSLAARQLGAILVTRAAAARSHALAMSLHQWTSFASHRRRQLEAFQVPSQTSRGSESHPWRRLDRWLVTTNNRVHAKQNA